MAGSQRPTIKFRRSRDQCEGLSILVLMDARRAWYVNIVHHDHRPITNWHIFEFVKCINGCRNAPNRCQIAGRLPLQGCRDFRDISTRYLIGFRYESELTNECGHNTSSPQPSVLAPPLPRGANTTFGFFPNFCLYGAELKIWE